MVEVLHLSDENKIALADNLPFFCQSEVTILNLLLADAPYPVCLPKYNLEPDVVLSTRQKIRQILNGGATLYSFLNESGSYCLADSFAEDTLLSCIGILDSGYQYHNKQIESLLFYVVTGKDAAIRFFFTDFERKILTCVARQGPRLPISFLGMVLYGIQEWEENHQRLSKRLATHMSNINRKLYFLDQLDWKLSLDNHGVMCFAGPEFDDQNLVLEEALLIPSFFKREAHLFPQKVIKFFFGFNDQHKERFTHLERETVARLLYNYPSFTKQVAYENLSRVIKKIEQLNPDSEISILNQDGFGYRFAFGDEDNLGWLIDQQTLDTLAEYFLEDVLLFCFSVDGEKQGMFTYKEIEILLELMKSYPQPLEFKGPQKRILQKVMYKLAKQVGIGIKIKEKRRANKIGYRIEK